MLNSFRGETERSSLSRGLSEVLEHLMQLIVRDCIAVWIDDITSDHDLIKQQLMLVKSVVTLRAKLSGAVYCNRSCLWVCLCVCVGSVTMITRNCVHRSSPNWVCR